MDALCQWTSEKRTKETLLALMKRPAPSQMGADLRGRYIEETLRQWGTLNHDGVAWHRDWKGTGNGVLQLGDSNAVPIWFLAHWDTIGFMVGPYQEEMGYRLTPFFHHFMTSGQEPGIVFGYSESTGEVGVVTKGTIIGGDPAYFRPKDQDVELVPGMRVAFDCPAEDLGSGFLRGQLDDALGCAAQMLAAGFLADKGGVPALFAFTDEEEGPVATGTTSFSRGSARLIHRLPPPQAAFVSDCHRVGANGQGPQMGDGALACEFASAAKGGVTPPWLWVETMRYMKQYQRWVKLHVNTHGSCSRSDCIRLMEVTPNILLWSAAAPGGRHFHGGANTCSISDVAHLARAMVLAALWARDYPWPE